MQVSSEGKGVEELFLLNCIDISQPIGGLDFETPANWRSMCHSGNFYFGNN